MNKIVVQEKDFDLSTEVALAQANDGNIGAVVSFVGLVRDLNDTPIQKMTLEHYPGMTEKALQSIVDKARNQWSIGNITIIHRVGDLAVNDQIVLVVTTSKHRKNAFDACEFIMDYLKTQAPFWKKEVSKEGGKWVEAKDSDQDRIKQHQNPQENSD
ncbi:Molybdopterin synthase catalytic subunit MoaE (EC 2.8.1.12) [uncultured Gammaproteobacteria bacterium]|jgi:molybdopterin synthase catalytic subunit|uniref:Molybdopterin synthase catalytic subunit n=3 Tax=sulfur-oxidizing symbionts TaxID=32036 RepID=A0A1H6JQR2_9GAMM|nr:MULTISPECIES: molybdopterin synthase catalytic subunit MoaE [Gammaproteobacteria]CAC5829162.1 Molybdopterin synthase catalytic subunit MoaE (EC 2.8.1.12) [uncultured Gammaproteobacteria bacterium]CAB5501045.1 Molybdopterin synthase catalytic subunit MoaE (EC [Bathymodiolus thermophilus thioautotrophic gill symbiont]CAB5507513.1 Molybdopterin synthase catalytic subunit MoaE (EC [Bathymodiolus azoricus thioautotrophic gill symbiont]CAC9490886.1 Molybdopterin synthase catalytic subunit MoaE (EC